jgi:hypothetical protein
MADPIPHDSDEPQPSPAPKQPVDSGQRLVIGLLLAAIVLWGIWLAVGAYISAEPNHFDRRRGLIVLACTLAFVGFWGALLWGRARRLRR